MDTNNINKNNEEVKDTLKEKEFHSFGNKIENEKYFSAEELAEKEQSREDEKRISKEIEREMLLMDGDEALKKEAQEKSQKIKLLGEPEKIENLLKLAREKGVMFAIKVAKSMNDPFLLDTLHDLLAKEGFYKDLK